jgi:hypothetical protein
VRSWTDSALRRLDEPPKSELDRIHKERVRANITASAGIVRELNEAGVPAKLLGEAANYRLPCPEAIPVLLGHVECENYPEDIRSTLFQALASPEGGRAAFEALCRVARSHPTFSESTLYTLGTALAATATRNEIPELVEATGMQELGSGRLPLLLRLARWRAPAVTRIATRFLNEDNEPWYAIRALRLARAWDKLPDVERYLTSGNLVFRAEAKKFVKACADATKKLTG